MEEKDKEWDAHYVSDEGRHRLVKVTVVANGMLDLCLARGFDPNSPIIKKISEVPRMIFSIVLKVMSSLLSLILRTVLLNAQLS